MTHEQLPFVRDVFAAIVLILVALVGGSEALSFPTRAAAWPLAMWGALIAFSLVLLLSAVRGLIRTRAQSR